MNNNNKTNCEDVNVSSLNVLDLKSDQLENDIYTASSSDNLLLYSNDLILNKKLSKFKSKFRIYVNNTVHIAMINHIFVYNANILLNADEIVVKNNNLKIPIFNNPVKLKHCLSKEEKNIRDTEINLCKEEQTTKSKKKTKGK
ncbi:MAG: hypothetical protein KIT69_09175 [Propionibacteriaceae bacterium]|nr:hypothetical protein [Propionibacteriaceae bacterium]